MYNRKQNKQGQYIYWKIQLVVVDKTIIPRYHSNSKYTTLTTTAE